MYFQHLQTLLRICSHITIKGLCILSISSSYFWSDTINYNWMSGRNPFAKNIVYKWMNEWMNGLFNFKIFTILCMIGLIWLLFHHDLHNLHLWKKFIAQWNKTKIPNMNLVLCFFHYFFLWFMQSHEGKLGGIFFLGFFFFPLFGCFIMVGSYNNI